MKPTWTTVIVVVGVLVLGCRCDDSYEVDVQLTSGSARLRVHPSWAPLGAQRFGALLAAGYYSDNSVFRVVPGFVCQFGISGEPAVSLAWEGRPIDNDPVVRSNLRGTVAFAAEYVDGTTCCRTTQLYVNYGNNSRLDAYGFAPFAEVVAGMDSFDGVNAEYGEQPDQELIYSQGNAYVQANFPNISYIVAMSAVDKHGTPVWLVVLLSALALILLVGLTVATVWLLRRRRLAAAERYALLDDR